MPRLHCPTSLSDGLSLDLPPGAARHAQVLRLQPGDAVTLFTGEGGEFEATIERMGRSDVAVRVGVFHPLEREAPRVVVLAVGMPANERMDWLVEKAAELGVAGIQPLLAERSVLRVTGERAARKQAHWQAIAIAACEQCGRNRVPAIAPVLELARWCADPGLPSLRLALSLAPDAKPLASVAAREPAEPVLLLSGPEGGLSPAELTLLASHGFQPASLGPRVLRADTAPLAALAALTLI